MPSEIQYNGKTFQVYSTVVDGFTSPEFNTPEEVADWLAGRCRVESSGIPVAHAKKLTCKCDGVDLGRVEKDALRFESGVSLTKFHGDPKHIESEVDSKVITQEDFCDLIRSRAVTEAKEAKITYEIHGHWVSGL